MLFVAAWALVTGVLEVVSAIRLRKEIKGEFWLALSGVASIVLAFLLISAPEAGALVLVLWLGIWALMMGTCLWSCCRSACAAARDGEDGVRAVARFLVRLVLALALAWAAIGSSYNLPGPAWLPRRSRSRSSSSPSACCSRCGRSGAGRA